MLADPVQQRAQRVGRAAAEPAHGGQKKIDTRETWLMIEGPSFQWAVKVEPAMSAFARDFAAKMTSAGNAAAPAQQPAVSPGLADELRKLAELRDAGVLTLQEFDAAKARILGWEAPRSSRGCSTLSLDARSGRSRRSWL